jgi:hypothetical protein
VVEFHKNSVSWALIELFPEVEFDIRKFGDIPRNMALVYFNSNSNFVFRAFLDKRK